MKCSEKHGSGVMQAKPKSREFTKKNIVVYLTVKHVKLTAEEQGNCIPGMGAALIVVLAKLSTYTNTSPINAHMLMMVWVMAHNQS